MANKYLSFEKSHDLLAIALKGKCPALCRSRTATHACGTALAALVTRTIQSNIRLLKAMLLYQIKEMRHLERAFNLDTAETHFRALHSIHSHVSALISHGNLFTECFRLFPDTALIVTAIDVVKLELEKDIVNRLLDFIVSVDENTPRKKEVPELKDEIREIVTIEIPPKLNKLADILAEQAEPKIAQILENLESDWDRDLGSIRKKKDCKPEKEPKPPKGPEMLPDFPDRFIQLWIEQLKHD